MDKGEVAIWLSDPLREEEYRLRIMYTTEVLKIAEQEMFTAIANLSRAGIYYDVFNVFEPGEGIEMDLAMFEDTKDENVNLLSELMRHVIGVREYLSDSFGLEKKQN